MPKFQYPGVVNTLGRNGSEGSRLYTNDNTRPFPTLVHERDSASYQRIHLFPAFRSLDLSLRSSRFSIVSVGFRSFALHFFVIIITKVVPSMRTLLISIPLASPRRAVARNPIVCLLPPESHRITVHNGITPIFRPRPLGLQCTSWSLGTKTQVTSEKISPV
jgi:hypothetical protein